MYVYFKNRQKQYVLGKICFKTVFVFVISKHITKETEIQSVGYLPYTWSV